MGIIPNLMPNPKTAVLPTAVLFYTVNAADAAVDYDASHLWITDFALWITLAGLAVDFPALRARARISGPACCGLVD